MSADSRITHRSRFTDVLVVEDHIEMAEMLQHGLQKSGHTVDVACDGLEGERHARDHDYDLLIVDWVLPGQDGTSLIRKLRRQGNDTPILMLTGRSQQEDEVRALTVGADDYLTKPFSFEVLLSRLNALHRRHHRSLRDHTVMIGALTLDLQKRTASLHSQPLDLRAKEFDLLMVLADEPNTVVTRMVLAQRVWDTVYVTDDVLNTTVSSLRRKISGAQHDVPDVDAASIETLRGVGYRLALPKRETS